MPEKPEVVTVSKVLQKKIIGTKIKDVIIRWDKIIQYPDKETFINKILDQEILAITTRGKWIVITLTNDMLLIHLRMEGKFFFRQEINDIQKHDHVIFKLDNNQYWAFNDTRKFGKMLILDKYNYEKVKPLSELGLEYDDHNLTGKYLKSKISTKRLPIKTILLDQTIITGIGNIYDDEILFRSKIHPLKKPSDLSNKDYDNIVKYTKEILEKSIQLGGTTIHSYTSEEGVTGLFQNELLVHTKKVCPICQTDIIKIKVNGRGTYYCPKCQKI